MGQISVCDPNDWEPINKTTIPTKPMKKSLMILSALCLLPLGSAVAGPDCKTKCASKAKATAVVAKGDCDKAKCAKATVVSTKCAKAACDKAGDKAALVSTECNFKCEKSVAKLFASHDKYKDGKLTQAEFMALINATMNKEAEVKTEKVTAAN